MIVHFSAHISKWELVCKFGVIFHIFIISCLCSRFHVWNQWFFYSVITFSYTKCFVHSYTVDVVFTLSYRILFNRIRLNSQHYMLAILYCQYHACWCSGDFRSQCISRHGIDPQSQNILSPASEELITHPLYFIPNLTHWGRVTHICFVELGHHWFR